MPRCDGRVDIQTAAARHCLGSTIVSTARVMALCARLMRCGLTAVRCNMPRVFSAPTPSTECSKPTAPDAGSVCPIEDFTAEMVRGAVRAVSAKSTSTACAAPTSIGSPKDVPVPCISSPSTTFGVIPAVCKALRTTRC